MAVRSQCLEVAKNYRFKASDFFVIYRRMLVTFTASLIFLTVLFVQLINQSGYNSGSG
jgi:hypothetical protein